MINYIEKGVGLHAKLNAAGHWLEDRDGKWVSSDDEAVQSIIDSYSLSECQDALCKEIDKHAARLRDKVTEGVSPAEMASWSLKSVEASAKEVDPAAATPMLDQEADVRGVSVDSIAARVRVNAAALMSSEAAIAGIAGKHKDAVRTLTSFDQVAAYDWHVDWIE